MRKNTKEKQYSILFDTVERHGQSNLGIMFNESWNEDPRRSLFTLSRYKFVSKMLAGTDGVLEIGCADAFATRLVQQTVTNLTAIDFDSVFIQDIRERYNPHWPFSYFEHDILNSPVPGKYNAAYALDVLEHIPAEQERRFIDNIVSSLSPQGVLIVGAPSLESQVHASPQSKEGHVNCKSGVDLQSLFKDYFSSVFLFSMNDEVIHTGFTPMAHYVMVLCCGPKGVQG